MHAPGFVDEPCRRLSLNQGATKESSMIRDVSAWNNQYTEYEAHMPLIKWAKKPLAKWWEVPPLKVPGRR